jgi:hypothetical protein
MGLFDEKKYRLDPEMVDDIVKNCKFPEIHLFCAQILRYILKEDRYPVISNRCIKNKITSLDQFRDYDKWNKVFDEFRFTNFVDKQMEKPNGSEDARTAYMYSRLTENIGLAVHSPKLFALCDIAGIKRKHPRSLFLERVHEIIKEHEEFAQFMQRRSVLPKRKAVLQELTKTES